MGAPYLDHVRRPKSTPQNLTPAVGWQVSVYPAQGTSKRQGQDPGRHEGGPGDLYSSGNYRFSKSQGGRFPRADPGVHSLIGMSNT